MWETFVIVLAVVFVVVVGLAALQAIEFRSVFRRRSLPTPRPLHPARPDDRG